MKKLSKQILESIDNPGVSAFKSPKEAILFGRKVAGKLRRTLKSDLFDEYTNEIREQKLSPYQVGYPGTVQVALQS